MRILLFVFLNLIRFQSVWALELKANFKEKINFGIIKNYEDQNSDLRVSVSDSELDYKDINSKNANEIEAAYKAKQEYGKLFGFKDWTPLQKKFSTGVLGNFFLLNGHYKNSEEKTVWFLEVYWANPKQSKEFLFTSEKNQINLDDFARFFNP